MTRRTGEISAHDNDRRYPYVVEIEVPTGGFGDTQALIEIFHLQIGVEVRGVHWHRDGRDYARWCFADPRHASSFAALFDGTVIT